MKTVVVLLNYNDYENTSNYVEFMSKYNSIDKILIVDNNSTNENEVKKLEKLNSDKVETIVSDKNGGYAYGNNFGLRYLDLNYKDEFDYIIISNPDVFVEENNIKKTLEFLEKNDKAIIAAPRMHFKTGAARRSAWKRRSFFIDVACSTRITELLLFYLLKKGEYSKDELKESILEVFAIAGSFFIAKHEMFKKIGYFDENTFLFFEEDILAEKVKRAGYKIYSLNSEKFIHYESKSIGKAMNVFKKQDILFDSRIYYHKTYENIGKFKVFILNILRYIRKFELLFEIPIRKVLRK